MEFTSSCYRRILKLVPLILFFHISISVAKVACITALSEKQAIINRELEAASKRLSGQATFRNVRKELHDLQKLKKQLGIAMLSEKDLGAALQENPGLFSLELTPEELKLLSDEPILRTLYLSSLFLKRAPERVSSLPVIKYFSPLGNFFTANPELPSRSFSASFRRIAWGESGFIEESAYHVDRVIDWLGEMVKPLPSGLLERLKFNSWARKAQLENYILKNPTATVDQLPKQLMDYVNSNPEIREAFEQQRWNILQHPTAYTFRSYAKAIQTLLRNLAFGGIVYMAARTGTSGVIPWSVYQNNENQSADMGGDMEYGEVQLLSDTTPFPHLALRIGSRVYSYGTDFMTATNFEKYFSGRLEKSGNSTLTVPAVQVVILRFKKAEIAKLASYLESQNGKFYSNFTGINDCSSMLVRALRSFTSLNDVALSAFDFSPGITVFQLASRKGIDSHVGSSFVIDFSTTPTTPSVLLARNAWINMVESRFFISAIPYIYSKSAEFTLEKIKDDLQFFSPLQKKKLVEIETAYRDELMKAPIIKTFTQEIQKAESGNLTSTQISSLQKDIDITFAYLRKNYTDELSLPQLESGRRLEVASTLEQLNKIEASFKSRLSTKP